MNNIIATPIKIIISIVPTTLQLLNKMVGMIKAIPNTIRQIRALPWRSIAKSVSNKHTLALFYRNNKTYILSTTLIVVGVFFVISWTNNYFNNKSEKIKADIVLAEKTLLSSMALLEKSKNIEQTQNLLQDGLITYMQDLSQKVDLNSDQIKITPRAGTNSTEQLNTRLDGLTLYQLTEILKNINSYDNLAVVSINIKPQFNDDKKLLVTISLAKEITR